MRVLHTISGMGINSGGTTVCLHNLATGLLEQGIDVEILTFYPDHNDSLISNENYINALNQPIEGRYGYSLNFRNELLKYRQVDIIHATQRLLEVQKYLRSLQCLCFKIRT